MGAENWAGDEKARVVQLLVVEIYWLSLRDSNQIKSNQNIDGKCQKAKTGKNFFVFVIPYVRGVITEYSSASNPGATVYLLGDGKHASKQ